MKMVMAVMPRSEAENILQALVTAGYTATYHETRGGILRQAQMTLFIATEEEKLQNVLHVIEKNCHSHVSVETTEKEAFAVTKSATTKVGGAVVFVWDLDKFEVY